MNPCFEPGKRRTAMMPKAVVAALGPRTTTTVLAPERYGKSNSIVYMAGRSDFWDPQVSLVKSIKEKVAWDSEHGEVKAVDPESIAITKKEKPNSIPGAYKFYKAAMKVVRSAIHDEKMLRVWIRKEFGGYFVLLADRVLYVQAGPGGHWKLTRVPEEGLA